MYPGSRNAETDHRYLVTATRQGLIKKTRISECSNIRKGGLLIQSILEGDELMSVEVSSGQDEFLISSKKGKCIRFSEADVRATGRGGQGVRSIRLDEGDEVVDMVKIVPGGALLTVTERGMGKRTSEDQYRAQGRGGKGITAMNLTEKTGDLACCKMTSGDEDMMLVRDDGTIIRTPVSQVPAIGRATQGVRLMRVDEGTRVVCVALAPHAEEEPEEDPAPETQA
jgi:DNA gyrase subunit A